MEGFRSVTHATAGRSCPPLPPRPLMRGGGWRLPVVVSASFMAVSSTSSVVNVSPFPPTMAAGTFMPVSRRIQFVIAGMRFAYAGDTGFTGGRLGDIYGRQAALHAWHGGLSHSPRRSCGPLAPGPGASWVGRAARAGVSALALLSPHVLSIIQVDLPTTGGAAVP